MKAVILSMLLVGFLMFPTLLLAEGEGEMPSLHEEMEYTEEDVTPYEEEEVEVIQDALPDVPGDTQKRPFEGVEPEMGTTE